MWSAASSVTCLISRSVSHSISTELRPRQPSNSPARRRADQTQRSAARSQAAAQALSSHAGGAAADAAPRTRRQTVDYTMLAACVEGLQAWVPAKIEQVSAWAKRRVIPHMARTHAHTLHNLDLGRPPQYVRATRRWCNTTDMRSQCGFAPWKGAASCTCHGTRPPHAYTSALHRREAQHRKHTVSVRNGKLIGRGLAACSFR